MPSISSCPECHRDLTLPDLADGKQTLRCPLCDAQFPAERLMADSVSFPPTAIVVSSSDAPAIEQPAENKPWPTATFHDTGTDEDAGFSSEHESEVDESEVDESDIDESEVDRDDEDDSSSEDSQVAHSEASPDYASFGRQAAGMRTAPRTRQQASPLGALGQFVGMAIGGVLGLAIGYWVLLWIGGAQADFLHLRGKLPRWLVPARHHNDAGKNLPSAARQGDRPSQPGRSLGEVLRESDDETTHDAGSGDKAASSAPRPSGNEIANISAERSAATDARTAVPPNAVPLERLPHERSAFPNGYLGPRAFKSRTVSELTATLDKADRALRCPHCQAPAAVKLAAFTAPTDAADDVVNPRRCDYCRGKPLTNLTPTAFDRLCDLAEIVTFVQFDEDDSRRDDCRQAAEAITLAIGNQRERLEITGRLAGQRLDESQRQSNGIVLAGTVQRAEKEGELFAIQIMLLGCGKPVTVISGQPPEPPVQRRDRLVVLGSIVDSPRDNLAGYAGNLSQVVWGGLPIKLASSVR